MATPLPKKEQREFVDDISRFETATETMADYIGYLHRMIRQEKEQDSPNEEKIEALDAQCLVVVRERHAITSDNEPLIRKALYVYAPFMKALRGK